MDRERYVQLLARCYDAHKQDEARAIKYATRSVLRAKRVGDLAIKLQDDLDHGEWMPFAHELILPAIGVTHQHLNKYMKVARQWDEIDPALKKVSFNKCYADTIRREREDERYRAMSVESPSPEWAVLNKTWELPRPNPRQGRRQTRWTLLIQSQRHLHQRQQSVYQLESEPTDKPDVFMDSGAFGLKKEAKKYADANDCSPTEYFKSNAFRQYIIGYVQFIKQYSHCITFYANLDVIGDADLSARNLAYLESKGLKPVPVIHFGTDLRDVRYLFEEYEYIGLGNLVGNLSGKKQRPECREWVADCFHIAHDGIDNGRRPNKLHGFGVGNFNDMIEFDWESVDATTWQKIAEYGKLIVPKESNGSFDFLAPPKYIHVENATSTDRAWAQRWVQSLGMDWDDVVDGDALKYSGRRRANLLYFEALQQRCTRVPNIYYSSDTAEDDPVYQLGAQARVMPSYRVYHDTVKHEMPFDRLVELAV